MPLVINGLGGGHTHISTHEPKQFQETRCTLAAHAWFEKPHQTHKINETTQQYFNCKVK